MPTFCFSSSIIKDARCRLHAVGGAMHLKVTIGNRASYDRRALSIHPLSNLPCSQVECLHSGPSLDPSSILYPEQPHCRLQSACRRGSEASVTASVHLTTGVPYHPSSLPPTHWQPRIIRQSGFPNAKLLVNIAGAQTSRFGCMQLVRYAEVPQLIV